MSHHHLIVRRVNFYDIEWSFSGNANTSTLANRIMMDAGMMAHRFAVSAVNLPRPQFSIRRTRRLEVAIDKTGVVTVGNKTYLLRFGFLRDCQGVFSRDLPDLRLRHLTQRKHRRSEEH